MAKKIKSSDVIQNGTPVKSVTGSTALYEPGITINFKGKALKIYRIAQHTNGDVYAEEGNHDSTKFAGRYIRIPSKNIKNIEYYRVR